MNTLTKMHSLPACPSVRSLSDHSLQMVFAQILWWGIGLTLAYDTAETVFHWPHWLAMSLYGGLMIVSAWLGVRAMTFVGVMLVPALLAAIYFSMFDAIEGSSVLSVWTQMVSTKGLEYIGWFLLVLGSFISGQIFLSGMHKQKSLLTALGVLSLALGAYMMLDCALANMQASGQSNKMLVLVQQGSYFMWLIGLSAKNSAQDVSHRRALFVFPKLPIKPIVLLAGTTLIVGYDYLAQHLMGGWQYFTMVLPPIAMMLTRKWGSDFL